jgi:endoglucanase
LLVVYHIPDRDCGSYSGGGARDADDYARWIRTVAARLRGVDATVVLEPDAVPHELSGCVGSADRRRAMLADAVDVLKAAGPVTVYLDAGNPGFVTDVDALAAALRGSGLDRADGFSLNVANFWTTADNTAFGLELSQRLDGKHFVIDTSRNGNGPIRGATVDGGPTFCNPPGRALGRVPTSDTGTPQVDDYLWIKRVGESDGACRPGEPPAGQWWPEYALELARG